MSWHLAVYTGPVGQTANTDIPALTDQVLTIFNNHFLLRKPMQLLAAMAMSTTIERARFDSPSLRYYGNPYIRPVLAAAIPGTDPPIDYFLDRPFMLPSGEEIAIQATSGLATGTEQATVALFLMDQLQSLPGGNFYPVRFTGSTVAVANKWTSQPIVMDTGLPSGQYALLYSELQSASGQFHRWIFDEQVYRPGLPMISAITQQSSKRLSQFPLGVMGTFRNDALPRLEVLCNGADATFEGYMYLQKIAA